jgi:hypothetical protein
MVNEILTARSAQPFQLSSMKSYLAELALSQNVSTKLRLSSAMGIMKSVAPTLGHRELFARTGTGKQNQT